LNLEKAILSGRFAAEKAKAFNPRAFDAAFARFSHRRDAEGNYRIGDRFGFGGYQVPLPDELKMKAGTIYPQGMQLVTQPLWDGSNTFTTASTTALSFFATAQSGIAGNLVTQGQLPFPTSFIIRAIRFLPQVVISTTNATTVVGVVNDISLLIYNGFHTLAVLSKEYLRLPLFMLPGGAGVGGTAIGATLTASQHIDIANHGMPDPTAIWTLLDPLWLETQVAFVSTATWNGTQATQSSPKIFLVYDGQRIQPVQ
jgi:hypothetical protein